MKTLLSMLACLALFSCSSEKKNEQQQNTVPVVSDKQPATASLDTITTLDEMGDRKRAIFKAPNGDFYLVGSDSAEIEVEDDEPLAAASVAEALAKSEPKARNKPCETEVFDGVDRKATKTVIDPAKTEEFNSLTAFFKTLPTDKAIGSDRKPEISSGPTSKRVKEEKRNVRITQAWLYTFKRQSDEDYHVIIGSTKNKATAVFFNVEISGLPNKTSSSYAKMNAVRQTFKDFFGINNSCNASYSKTFINNPVPIEISGSLFFDKLHYDGHGKTGPEETKPESYWEIHPVTGLVFK